ncbi:NACHT, LRR and PYD domains-containing protein 1b allele 1-like isoform X3 [Phasianus colchicus]|uniref:NACHT, LRR and PYD domains-containing protein 1b allele 1-like isoform X3 n=1 Tax=Phasianus colchicus TaxID=9054 RepID=UPI00129E962E|nr:NACHT, LRR and PYD domains-containing protein 1b allele 1-like isoform X3 [Phasianus colchicus]
MTETTLSSTFSILVKCLSGKNIFIPVSLDDTVLDLKMKLFALESEFYPSALILNRDASLMKNKLTLRHYNITSNSIIQQTCSLRVGGSAPLKSKEDVSGDQKPDIELKVLPSYLVQWVEMKHGQAGASSWMESKGITSTSAKNIQKWPQSDVPAEERSCRCVKQELQDVRPKIDPHILKEQNIYKACLPGPGTFQCSETGLAFEVESAATIVYRYDSWSTHLKEADQNVWVPAGPLFNIWALPGTVRAVYLPHFICLSDVDISGCSIAHFEFQKMTMQQPTEVMAFSAVLENPSFSLLGVVWRKLRSAISLPMHSLVLIFQQLRAANTTLHLYLIPDDNSVKQVR